MDPKEWKKMEKEEGKNKKWKMYNVVKVKCTSWTESVCSSSYENYRRRGKYLYNTGDQWSCNEVKLFFFFCSPFNCFYEYGSPNSMSSFLQSKWDIENLLPFGDGLVLNLKYWNISSSPSQHCFIKNHLRRRQHAESKGCTMTLCKIDFELV